MDNSGIIERFAHMHGKEKRLEQSFDESYHIWKRFLLKLNKAEHVAADETIHLMGSMHDGACTARVYSEKHLTTEADFMVEVIEIRKEYVDPVHGHPGFYRIRNDGHLYDRMIGLAQHFKTDPRTAVLFRTVFLNKEIGGINHESLMGVAIKVLVKFVANLPDGKPAMEAIMSKMYGDQGKVTCELETDFNGPATTQTITTFVNGQRRLDMCYDVVVAGRLSFWPEEAKDWEHRPRKWPPRSTVESIIKEHKVHLVAKPLTDVQAEQSTEWRLTFLAERRIIEEQTDDMKFTYFLFKILFYKYFKTEIGGKSLASYLAKTTMFWLCEEIEPSSWTFDNIQSNLKALLAKLFQSLDNGRLPQYFIPDINLLGPDKRELVKSARGMDMRPRLLDDPVGCVPVSSIANAAQRVDELIRLSKVWTEHYRLSIDQLPRYPAVTGSSGLPSGRWSPPDDDDLD